jgi:MOSC domain-containing protein
MDRSEVAGRIESLWRFPVKSMLGEQLEVADVDEGGVVGDRAYALIDRQTGKVASAKHPKLWPDLLACRATFVEPPTPAGRRPPIRVELADGTSVTSDAADVDTVLSRFFGREVQLAHAAPDDFTIDQYHPDLENLDPQGHRDELTESKLGAPLFRELGMPSAVPVGSFMDVCPLSLLTTSSLNRLSALEPESRFDVRRFRMNLIIDTPEPGFVENTWLGRALEVGDEVRLAVVMPDPRCVMTTVAQPDLANDPRVLKTLARHNRIDVAGGGLYPCLGVYAVAVWTGTIRKGDRVRPI